MLAKGVFQGRGLVRRVCVNVSGSPSNSGISQWMLRELSETELGIPIAKV